MSRRESTYERRKTRRGFLLILASVGLLLFFIFVGLKYIANLALWAEKFKKETDVTINDKTPPAPPRLDTKIPKYTNKEIVDLEGYAESGSLVKIYLNGEVVKEITASEESRYSTQIKLKKGENQIWATATDSAGNEGEQSPNRYVVFDSEAPIIEVLEPKNGETVSDKDISIKGKTEAGSQITANERLGTVNSEGNFSVKYTLSEGENTIKLISVDGAENRTEKELIVTFEP